MTQVWQIAAGERQRDYTRIFLDYDVMLIGPGRYGPYNDMVYQSLVEQGLWTGQKIGMIKHFSKTVQAGDIILLRNTYKVIAIGIVADEEYMHNNTFDDIYGWDLQHTRRIIWQQHLETKLSNLQTERELFESRKQIPAFTAVKDRNVLDPIKHLFDQCKSRALKPMTASIPEPLTLEKLGEELFSKGLSNEAVDKLIVAIRRQQRLAKWYDEYGEKSKRPTEHEVVAHMILPLMLALGWSEQLLAVEWKHIDFAAFLGTPTTPENCCLVCEAKGYGHGLQDVFTQATNYAKNYKLDNCKRILLTDGKRLYLHQRRKDDSWDENPVGYLNVKLIRTNHIAPAGTSAIDTIMALTPAGITRAVGK